MNSDWVTRQQDSPRHQSNLAIAELFDLAEQTLYFWKGIQGFHVRVLCWYQTQCLKQFAMVLMCLDQLTLIQFDLRSQEKRICYALLRKPIEAVHVGSIRS